MDTCNRLMDEILRTDGHQASCVRVRGLRSSSNNWYAAQTVSGMRGRVWATSFPLDSLEDPFCVDREWASEKVAAPAGIRGGVASHSMFARSKTEWPKESFPTSIRGAPRPLGCVVVW